MPISEASVNRPSSRESNGDRLKVAQPGDTDSARHGRIARPDKTARTQVTNFKPPSGSWEDAIEKIDACEGVGGTVRIYVTWKGGQKTQQTTEQVYKRCPQKVRDSNSPPEQRRTN
jgi:chromobox protein 1